MNEARLFSVMCSDRTRGSGQKQEHTFVWNFLQEFLYSEGHRPLEQHAQSPSLEIFKTFLDTFLPNLLWETQL